jgi:hypothetical protein
MGYGPHIENHCSVGGRDHEPMGRSSQDHIEFSSTMRAMACKIMKTPRGGGIALFRITMCLTCIRLTFWRELRHFFKSFNLSADICTLNTGLGNLTGKNQVSENIKNELSRETYI